MPAGRTRFDEHAVAQDQPLVRVAAQHPDELGVGCVLAVPGDGRDERFPVGDAADGVWVAASPVDAQHAAPVVPDDDDVGDDAEGGEQPVEVVAVVDEAVAAGSGAG